MRIAIYARTATYRPDEDPLSLRGQVAQVREWAVAEGHQVVDIYEEPLGVAGDVRRFELERMVRKALSPEHPYDALVAHSLSRFCRDSALFAFLLQKLRAASIQLVSITDSIPSDDECIALHRQFIRLLDEFATREHAKDVRRCMIANAQQGYVNGSRAPFGYVAKATKVDGGKITRRKLILAPHEARVVRTIFALFLQGLDGKPLGSYGIAAFLNKRGTLCRGNKWRSQMVRRILANPVYAGIRHFNQRDRKTRTVRPQHEWIAIAVPPIITQAESNQAHKALARSGKTAKPQEVR